MLREKKRLFPMRESKLIEKAMKEFLSRDSTIFYFKSHGEPMQVRGIPDIVASITGLFVAIEFKVMRSGKLNVTPYQEHTLTKVYNSKGAAFVFWFDEKTGEYGVQTYRFPTLGKAVEFVLAEIVAIKKSICENMLTLAEQTITDKGLEGVKDRKTQGGSVGKA